MPILRKTETTSYSSKAEEERHMNCVRTSNKFDLNFIDNLSKGISSGVLAVWLKWEHLRPMQHSTCSICQSETPSFVVKPAFSSAYTIVVIRSPYILLVLRRNQPAVGIIYKPALISITTKPASDQENVRTCKVVKK